MNILKQAKEFLFGTKTRTYNTPYVHPTHKEREKNQKGAFGSVKPITSQSCKASTVFK